MLIDSHCHLDFDEFAPDRAEVLASARSVGVSEFVVPGTSQSTWERTISVCSKHRLALALGMHPIFIDQHQPQHLLELDKLIAQQYQNCSTENADNERMRIVAVGEIGLDYFYAGLSYSRKEKQQAYFSKQLIIAKQHQLPVIIHCRKAHDDCLSELQRHSLVGGIIHAFSGSIQQAHKYIEMGFLLGFGGMLTFPRSRKLRKLAAAIPLDSIALETDAPDMTVAQHRGQRNSLRIFHWSPLYSLK